MLLAASIEQTLIRSYFIGCYRIWYWYYHTIIPEVVVISIEIQWYLTKSEAGCMTFSDLSDCSMEAGPSSGQCCCSFLPNGASSAPERARNQRNARMGDAQVQTVQRHLVEGFRTSIRWMHYRLVWWYMISMSWEIWKCIIVNHSTS